MNLNFSNLFSNQSSMNAELELLSGQSLTGTESSSQKLQNLMELFKLQIGSMISGQILSADSGALQIAVGDQVLQAKTEQGILLQKGQTITFEVSGQQDNQLILRPIYQNLDGNSTVDKALESAGIDKTPVTIHMVASMMEANMGIDRDSLLGMNRQIMQFPKINPETIVQMNQLQIPVNEENIEQFNAYQNYEHPLVKGIESVSDYLVNLFQEMTKDGKVLQAANLCQQIFDMFKGEEQAVPGIKNEENPAVQLLKQLESLKNEIAPKEQVQNNAQMPETLNRETAVVFSEVGQEHSEPKQNISNDAITSNSINYQVAEEKQIFKFSEADLEKWKSLFQSKEFENFLSRR